jgi:hypothetical protein
LNEGSSDASPEQCWRTESGEEGIIKIYTNYLKNQIYLYISKYTGYAGVDMLCVWALREQFQTIWIKENWKT